MEMPNVIHRSSGTTEYTVSDYYDWNLMPGNYYITITSDHPVDYQIEQKFKYATAALSLALLGVFGIIVLVGLLVLTSKRRNALRTQAAIAAYSAPNYAQEQLSDYSSAPHATYATPYDASRGLPSSITYVPGGVVVDYICGKCGNYIQNPPVQGVITCEICGEREYVQPPPLQ